MSLLQNVQQQFQQLLWQNFKNANPVIKELEFFLQDNYQATITLDHFAIIDLPGSHAGRHYLSQIFTILGYQFQGEDYLPDKQNDFLWMADPYTTQQDPTAALSQIVLADFRLEEMPIAIQQIITKYTSTIQPIPFTKLAKLAQLTELSDSDAAAQLIAELQHCLVGRAWIIPSVTDYQTIHEYNELLAWALVFGRIPNHFTVAVHLLNKFQNLNEFNDFITNEFKLRLNDQGGIIKGQAEQGLLQSASMGETITLPLTDGNITITSPFIEFIWRFPKSVTKKPTVWNDYFTGFIAGNANRIIESLYEHI